MKIKNAGHKQTFQLEADPSFVELVNKLAMETNVPVHEVVQALYMTTGDWELSKQLLQKGLDCKYYINFYVRSSLL